MVRSESRKREDLKKRSSWASIVDASSDADEETQSKVVSGAGTARSADVAGSGKMGPTRVWVKKGPTTGLDLCSGTLESAMDGNKIGMVVGPSTDLWSPAPQRPGSTRKGSSGLFDEKGHPAVPFQGLCDADFPPIRPVRPLTNLGTSRVAAVYKEGSENTKASSEVMTSLISVPNHSHPVQLDSRTDKKVFGKGKGASAPVLQSVEAKVSHNWRSLFVNRSKSCSPFAFYNPTTVHGKVTINPLRRQWLKEWVYGMEA